MFSGTVQDRDSVRIASSLLILFYDAVRTAMRCENRRQQFEVKSGPLLFSATPLDVWSFGHSNRIWRALEYFNERIIIPGR